MLFATSLRSNLLDLLEESRHLWLQSLRRLLLYVLLHLLLTFCNGATSLGASRRRVVLLGLGEFVIRQLIYY